MHTSAPHRARIIAAPTKHDEPAPDMPAAQLSRQAALFQRLREGTRAHARETDGDEQPCAAPAEPPFAEQADPLYPVAGFAADEHRDDAGSGERDDDAQAGSGDERDDATAHARSAAPVPAPVPAMIHPPMHSAMHELMHVPAYSTMPAPTPTPLPARCAAPLSPQRTPNAQPSMAAPDMPRMQATREPQRPEAGGAHAVVAVRAPARAGQDMNRFVDSIVAEVSDFCANPIVVESGDWQLTIPIDPALLPGCTLNLALSHFQLTLRFDTTDERSRELISQHATTLRESLEEVMQSRFDGTRSVEIIVT
ncbi:type III secretion system protein SctP [Burkholderia ambifaria]|uniref:type III secretion system protein SctP n=1 Tax=Burkholderia ambifaria TaxID=152480 RepID=UPI00158DEA40|nr:type III secretion system protein SctP [Burkholderia ambifaria]MBR8347647.1 type III secretion system protein SctP [Burkholderia ambifaria]